MCIRDRNKIVNNDYNDESVVVIKSGTLNNDVGGSNDAVSYTHLDVYKRQVNKCKDST